MNTQTTTLARGSISFPPVAVILLLAIVLNLILALAVPRVDWAAGGEISGIAASIASGRGFSSPFRQPTGPSAWSAPVYPYVLAGIFRLFGVFTVVSYWAAVAFNIIIHGFTCMVLYWAAGEAFGRRTGLYAAMALACFPLLFEPLVYLHVLGGYLGQGLFILPNSIWSTQLSELAIVLLIWFTLRRTHWAVYGITWGIAALINPTVLALVPAFLAWRVWHRDRWRDLGLAAATAALCVAPWLVRNYLVFHRPVFIRDGFGIELRVGNQPGSKGLWTANVHPDRSDYELSRLAEMGEIEYARVSGQEAMDTIRSRPGEFALNTIRRIGYYWIGTPLTSRRLHALRFFKYLPQLAFSLLAFCGMGRALIRGNRKALLFVAVLFFYPLVYYITHTFYGFTYQYPIQPEMLALAISVVIRENTTQPIEGQTD
jgi:Dolichyl-phosphate-mannose-protein mannosyltransferase